MRLILLAIILLLCLTLANAFILRNDLRLAAAENYVGTSGVVQNTPSHNEWNRFVWREIGAFVITAVMYGVIVSLGRRR
jgi:hypothetical protein